MQDNQPKSTKKLSVILDAKLHNQAKRFAVINDMTLTELVVSLLEERLSQEGQYTVDHSRPNPPALQA
jgi:macrodomain Ter protein organizer (MatP/YcbG family)